MKEKNAYDKITNLTPTQARAKLERRQQEFEKTMSILVDAAGIDHTQAYWSKNWHELKKPKLYRVQLLFSGACEKDCLLRVVELRAAGKREAIELARKVSCLDEDVIESISEEVYPMDQGFEPIELLSVQEVRSPSTARTWTKEQIDSDDFEACFETPMQRMNCTAHHEAGHAFLAYLNDFQIDEVAVFDPPQRGRGGKCVISGGLVPADDLLLYTVAGPVSQGLYLEAKFNLARMIGGGSTYLGGRADYDDAVQISRGMHERANDRLIEAHITYVAERLRLEYLEPNWHIVQRLAAALVEKKRLSGEEVEHICSASLWTGNVAT